jgi:opacity protein-like surface antigen
MHHFTKSILLFLFLVMLYQYSYSKNLYIKFDLPIKGKYIKNEADKLINQDKPSFKISNDNYGFGIGYNFNEYIESELTYNKIKYITLTSDYKLDSLSFDPANNIDPILLMRAYVQKDKNNIPDSINTDDTYLYHPTKSGEIIIRSKKYPVEKLFKNSKLNYDKLEDLNLSLLNMKLEALIFSLKLKAPTKKRFVPFLILGAGASKMKIVEINGIYNNKTNQMEQKPSLLNKTSFAYRVGVGMKFKMSGNSALEISARYFDYGKYELSNGDKKRIKGHDFSAGIVLGF